MFCEPGFRFFNSYISYVGGSGNYLEIGVFNGDSIAQLARNHPNKIIYAIDPFLEDGSTNIHTGVETHEFMTEQAKNTQQAIAGLSNVVLFQMTSEDFAKNLTDEMVRDMNVSWVLVDGCHEYRAAINDAHLAMRLIGSKPGAVVFDDVNYEPVTRAVLEFLQIYNPDRQEDLFELHPGAIMAYWVNTLASIVDE